MQNRASRRDNDHMNLGFMLSPSSDERVLAVREAVARLGQVEQCLVLGVLE